MGFLVKTLHLKKTTGTLFILIVSLIVTLMSCEQLVFKTDDDFTTPDPGDYPGGPTPAPTKPLVDTLTVDNIYRIEELTYEGEVRRHRLKVTPGQSYKVEWQDLGSNAGDFIYTVDITVSAYSVDSTPYFENKDAGYTVDNIITVVPGDDYLYLAITANPSESKGTYSIRVTEISTTSPTESPAPDTSIIVDTGYQPGEISRSGEIKWYRVDVTAGSSYNIKWEDGHDYTPNTIETYSLDIKVGVYREDQIIPYFSNEDLGYSSDHEITVAEGESYIYIKVEAYNDMSVGTYAVAVNTTIIMPQVPTLIVDTDYLTAAVPSSSDVDWYEVNVSAGSLYNITWQDIDGNDGLSTYGNIIVSAYRKDRTTPYFETEDEGYHFGRNVTVATGELKFYIKVISSTLPPTGNYKISVSYVGSDGYIDLIAGDASYDGIISPDEEVWFRAGVPLGGEYRIQWTDNYSNTDYTATISVSAYYSDLTTAYFVDKTTIDGLYQDIGINSQFTFTYFKITGITAGSYSLKFFQPLIR